MFLKFEKVKNSPTLKIVLFNLVLLLMFAMNPTGTLAAIGIGVGNNTITENSKSVDMSYKNSNVFIRDSELITFIVTVPTAGNLTIYDSNNKEMNTAGFKNITIPNWQPDTLEYTVKGVKNAEYNLNYVHDNEFDWKFSSYPNFDIEVTAADLQVLPVGEMLRVDQNRRMKGNFFKFTADYAGIYSFLPIYLDCQGELSVYNEDLAQIAYCDLVGDDWTDLDFNAGETYYLAFYPENYEGYYYASIYLDKGFLLDEHNITMNVGETTEISYTTNPVDSTIKADMGWYSDNESVATVKDGKVTAVGCGTANIRLQTNNVSDTCKVTVLPEITDLPVFTDVPADIWYYDSVYDLVGRGIVNGMTETTFAPNDNITRAQFAKILAAASGENTGRYDGKEVFTDCKGHWADEYINWAFDKGIVKGMSATEFAPNEKITREQMAAMICRYASYNGVDLPKINARLTFKDDSSIGGWAKDHVYAMQQAGIINGYADGSGYVFKPAGYATRAEAAKMISAFLNL